MGIPTLFRWLNNKYPRATVPVVEARSADPRSTFVDIDGRVRVDATLPNPNRTEFDCLYLDMNGIIHPCCHPEYGPLPETEEDMFDAVFDYVDRIFSMIRPRKLLYMAVDGVAPRAKMNQQRSRRFRAAQELESKRAENETDGQSRLFDSNCITPGTLFMDRLSQALKWYILSRLDSDRAWKSIQVILSDSSVPGEGEHKIMSYIRHQKADPEYNPNLNHVFYGLDADLIMLSLITHEAYFRILREDVFVDDPWQRRACRLCKSREHVAIKCPQKRDPTHAHLKRPFVFLNVEILRDYLHHEFSHDLHSGFDLERVIDDWVFLVFFVGNDFLPHLPFLDIRDGAIDLLVNVYKKEYAKNGYITEKGLVKIDQVVSILEQVGCQTFPSTGISSFRKRQSDGYEPNKPKVPKMDPPKTPLLQISARIDLTPQPLGPLKRNSKHLKASSELVLASSLLDSSSESLADKKEYYPTKPEPVLVSSLPDLSNKNSVDPALDHKELYYQTKLGKSVQDAEFVYQMVFDYLKGLCWIMAYYYRGCISWNWYYPYHYAPFASDFRVYRLFNAPGSRPDSLMDEFELGSPFKPFEQLLGVLPPSSRDLIPKAYHRLMVEETSPIIDFYPSEFQIDLNGKKFEWQGVVLLPFIDEHRLKSVAESVFSELSPEEQSLNLTGNTRLFVNTETHHFVLDFYKNPKLDSPLPFRLGGLGGYISKDDGVTLPGSEFSFGRWSITNQGVMSVVYLPPFYEAKLSFSPTTIQPRNRPKSLFHPTRPNVKNHYSVLDWYYNMDPSRPGSDLGSQK